MSYRTIPNDPTQYALLSFDSEGLERKDDPDAASGRFSTRIIEDLSRDPATTDVFLMSHGWKGDVPAAVDQYDRWIAAMNARIADRDRMVQKRGDFKPLSIGIHWPSQPWGDEELGAAGASFSVLDNPVDLYVERLGDRPGLREAIAVVVSEAAEHPDAEQLPPEAEQAYREIDRLLVELGAAGEGGAPGSDREAFDPQTYFEAARQEASFGLGDSLGGILAPLRQLSFWKMKQRGRLIGETGVHAFLADLQQAAGGRALHFHLMGHSFGCIVVSATLCGPASNARVVQPIASLALVQGALSLWSYCEDIPAVSGQSGYFRKLLSQKKVTGPILTTRSVFDTANGRYYPLGAGVANQVNFAPGELPRYGAVGSFGVQGIVPESTDMPMRPANEDYGFSPGKVYNLEASEFVRKGDGASGAHSDIDGPEVAHAIWQAALSVGDERPG